MLWVGALEVPRDQYRRYGLGAQAMAQAGLDPQQYCRRREIPWVSAVLGPCLGSSTWYTCLSDFVVMRKGAFLAVSSARVDGTLAALMTFALLVFYRGILRGGFSRSEALVAYVCVACATLTKGPVGFVLPGLVVLVALVALRHACQIALGWFSRRRFSSGRPSRHASIAGRFSMTATTRYLSCALIPSRPFCRSHRPMQRL